MKQIERIAHMEQILDEVTEVVYVLSVALENYIAIQDKTRGLIDYYESAQWRQDFNDDAAGKLPCDLKRGVLSEDAVYNLLMENAGIKEKFRTIST